MVTINDAPTILDIALDALEHGYSIVPPAEDGTKRPDGRWHTYQQRLPTSDELRTWYLQPRHGIGVICGAVSGNLEMLEFEGRAVDDNVHDQFAELAAAAGLTELVDRVFYGYSEWTPTGGLHLLYRVTGPVAGNTKLARRPATTDELQANPDDRIKVLIETRGEGGYCIVAPSHGPVHPAAGEWRLVNGGFATVATITPQERDELHRLARALDRQPATPAAPTSTLQPLHLAGDQRPGDLYNLAPDAPQRTLELLRAHGWTEVFRRGDDIHLRRPGKTIGTSAVLHYDGGVLYVFTSSTPFEPEQAYSPFGVYTTLEHGGDYTAAARALRPAGPGPGDLTDLVARPASTPAIAAVADDQAPSERADWQLPSPNVDEFLDEDEPDHVWLIPGLLERMDRVIVTAGEGVGKSTFIRQIGLQAAAGIHPFTLDDIPPITVVLLDLENSRRHVRRELRDLRRRTDTLDPDRFIASVVPEGIDLMHDKGLLALDDLLARVTPDLVIVGPLYKLASGDPKDEEQAQAVRAAIDLYRARYDCAFLIEAHQPYATGGSTKRPLRPYGASLWSRWPEFGLALVGEPGGDVELKHWRGARDERDWPTALNRGGEWPWSATAGRDLTFARMLAIARDYIAANGELPSVRYVSQRLTEEGLDGSSSSAVGRAIKHNRRQWEALLLDTVA